MANKRGKVHTNKNGHAFVVESKFIGTRKAVRALLKRHAGSNDISKTFHMLKDKVKATDCPLQEVED